MAPSAHSHLRRFLGPLRLTLLSVASLVWFSATGCERLTNATSPAKAEPTAPPPVDVSVTRPVEREIQDSEEFTGRTEAMVAVEVRARVSGYLEKIHFADGQDVKKDDLLFEIDPDIYQAEFDKATAAVDQAQARLSRLEKQLARAEELFSKKVMSEEDFELRTFERSEASAALHAAEAARKLAALNLGFTKIHAPTDGRISRRLVDEGNLVRADETPLAMILSVHPIHVYFDIDERTVLRLRRLIQEGKMANPRDSNLEVDISLADEQEYRRSGKVDFEDNHVDPTTGTLRVRLEVENDDRLLSPGLFVRLRFPVGPPRRALLIPEQALISDQGRRFVYVVGEGEKVVERPVSTGMLFQGMRVIDQGIAPNELVVLTGLQRLKSGKVVKFARPEAVSSDATVPGEAAPPGGSVAPDSLPVPSPTADGDAGNPGTSRPATDGPATDGPAKSGPGN